MNNNKSIKNKIIILWSAKYLLEKNKKNICLLFLKFFIRTSKLF
jgi:hypothetical protein